MAAGPTEERFMHRIKAGTYRRAAVFVASLALCAFVLATDAAAGGKKFSWTTKSKEAADLANQIVVQVESMSTGPQTLEQAKKIVALDPDFAFGHYLVATFSQGVDAEVVKAETAKTIELAQKASEGEREYMEAIFQLRANEADKALPRLVTLAEKYPDERMVHVLLGQQYMNRGKVADAKKHFERAIALDPSLPRVYAFIGHTELLSDNYPKAREYYTKAVSMAPKTAIPFPSVFGTVFSYVYEGNYDAAIKRITAFREEYEKSPNAAQFPPVFIWNHLARLHLESGKAQMALEYYQKGYESIPGSKLSDTDKKVWLGRMHHGMGRSLAKLGKHEEAWKHADTIKQMIETGGEEGKQYWPSYHYMAGYLKLEAGDYKAAVEHLKQAHIEDDDFHRLLLARAYEKAGDKENAIKTYQMIVDSKSLGIERALAYGEAKKKVKG
jgi:tetratricopeptide (TPR) repeat protein